MKLDKQSEILGDLFPLATKERSQVSAVVAVVTELRHDLRHVNN
jgi:hypothetical protein